jgi:hypothetical protein
MKKSIWIPLVIIIVGVCLAGAGFAIGGLKALQPVRIDKDGVHRAGADKLITIDEAYTASQVKSLVIDADYMDHVIVKEGEAGSKITVKGANYSSNGGLVSALSDGSLSVVTSDPNHRSGWIINLGISSVPDNKNCYLEITVPKGAEFDVLSAKIDAANIDLSGLAADTVMIDNDYGNIGINNVTAQDLTIRADAGNITGTDVRANEISVDNNYGDIEFKRLTLAGLCTVESDAGDVSISLTNAEAEVGYELTVNAGTITAGEDKREGAGDISLNSRDIPNEKAHVTADNNFGNITLKFGR